MCAPREAVFLVIPRTVTIMMSVLMILATATMALACTSTTMHLVPIMMPAQLVTYAVKEFVFLELLRYVMTATSALTTIVILILVIACIQTTTLLVRMTMPVQSMISVWKEIASLVVPKIVTTTTCVLMTPAIPTLVNACTRTTMLIALTTTLVH